jgi:hypothetical protein
MSQSHEANVKIEVRKDWLDDSSHFPPCIELEIYFEHFP